MCSWREWIWNDRIWCNNDRRGRYPGGHRGRKLGLETVLRRLYHDALKVVPRQPDSRSDKCMIGKAATVTRYLDSLRFESLAETEGMGTGPRGRNRDAL